MRDGGVGGRRERAREMCARVGGLKEESKMARVGGGEDVEGGADVGGYV